MRTIRIDEQVWTYLKQHAAPLEDTANSVLRRLVGLDTGQSAPHRREKQATNKLTPLFANNSLTLKFASGEQQKWALPIKKHGSHISKLFKEINSFIRGHGGTEGQVAGLRYQLHKHGCYVHGPKKQ